MQDETKINPLLSSDDEVEENDDEFNPEDQDGEDLDDDDIDASADVWEN